MITVYNIDRILRALIGQKPMFYQSVKNIEKACFILGFDQSCDQNKNRNHSIKNSRISDMIDDCNINNLAKN